MRFITTQGTWQVHNACTKGVAMWESSRWKLELGGIPVIPFIAGIEAIQV